MQALLNHIAQLQPQDQAQRVFHGRGGLHPGCENWALDAYPPVWLLTHYGPVAPEDANALRLAFQQRWQQLGAALPPNVVLQSRHEGRSQMQLLCGAVPEPHVVEEAGTRFQVHLMSGQNHGLFLDMAEGRRWVREHVSANPKQRVLNLFAYTCAFSVVALQAGAREVINLDMSRGALAIGQQNHRLNGVAEGARFLGHDLFTTWGKVTRSGPYGLVIVDPPSYQKGSFVAAKDYPRVMRRLPELLAPGGHALLCLNAPEHGPEFLQQAMAEQAPELQLQQRLPNPAVYADVSEARSLKVLVYRAPSTEHKA